MKRTLSISLSLLILFSSMGFTIATHFCGGHAMISKIALGHEHLQCGMESDAKNCEKNPQKHTLKSKACCENEYVSLGLDDEYQKEVVETFVNSSFVFAYIYSVYQIELDEDADHLVHFNHPPPLLDHDVQILYQSFLI